MTRILEWYFDLPATAAGEHLVWYIASDRPWPRWIPDWPVALALVLLLGMVIKAYHGDTAGVTFRARLSLILLRVCSVCLLAAMVCRPMLSILRTERATVAVLIDDSASMSLRDVAGDTIGSRSGDEFLSRHDLMQALIRHRGGRFLRMLSRHHELVVYRYSGSATPLGAEGGKPEWSQAVKFTAAILNLEATGSSTRHATSVQQVMRDFAEKPLAAIVVITDGVSTTGPGDRASAVVPDLVARRIPLYAVGLGNTQPMPDLELVDVFANDTALVGVPVTVAARVRSSGLDRARGSVRLVDVVGGRDLSEARFSTTADSPSQDVRLEFTPTEEGALHLQLQLRSNVSEVRRENNRSDVRLDVVKRGIRVLLVDRTPRWEFRALRHLLGRIADSEQTLELHTVLQESVRHSSEALDSDAQQLDRIPDVDELRDYHVVILGDVDPQSLAADGLLEFVNSGGGLVLIAGEQFSPGAFADTGWESLFPVALSSAHGIKRNDQNQQWPCAFTAIGLEMLREHASDANSKPSRLTDTELTPLEWFTVVTELSPGAVVLAEIDAVGSQPDRAPLIVRHEYGAGTVVFHATDETWRWRGRQDGDPHADYWLSLVRRLGLTKLRSDRDSDRLVTDRLQYHVGDEVSITLRRTRPGDASSDNHVTVDDPEGRATRIDLLSIDDRSDLYRGTFTPALSGRHTLRISNTSGGEIPATMAFEVVPRDPEREMSAADHEDLKLAARRTGGRFYTADSVSRLPFDLPRRSATPAVPILVVPLWYRWEPAAVLVLLVCAEWMLRRQHRMI